MQGEGGLLWNPAWPLRPQTNKGGAGEALCAVQRGLQTSTKRLKPDHFWAGPWVFRDVAKPSDAPPGHPCEAGGGVNPEMPDQRGYRYCGC